MNIKSYEDAGVSIEKGDRFAEHIKSISSPVISSSLGGFSGGGDLDLTGYKKPVLLSTTDGVGTKLLVAKQLNRYDTIGIDLVAMCVNDLAVCGAKPLQFLDYIACGKINEEILHAVIKGIVEGLEQADCVLAGGETAEMPDMYAGDDIDLAGFCVGIAEKDAMLPKLSSIREGDVLYGLPSSGIHSNGLSLARKAIQPDHPLYAELLVPTKIYVRELSALTAGGLVLAAAHITGGGLASNLIRVIPEGLVPEFSHDWPVPRIFGALQKEGGIGDGEMRKVFNMGVGAALVVSAGARRDFEALAQSKGIKVVPIGRLAHG
ncbi:MAG: phosphoribosylformylglycinamidine cyclo-ligase [Spirochaetales bacterium]|nr:MAG: phosphoribosylformylglycinamidine cyclo-ligase [Spirochaetales bacterium]